MTDFNYDHALRLEALREAVQSGSRDDDVVQLAAAFYGFLTMQPQPDFPGAVVASRRFYINVQAADDVD